MKEQAEDNSKTTKLADALKLLCSQKRSGKLFIAERGKKGEVFLVDGMITHAQCDRCAGIQALLFMLSWENGTYAFTPQQTSDQRSIEMETSDVLSLLSKRLHEWSLIAETNLLDLNDILCLLPQASGQIRLKKEEWDILARIDGRRSLREISDEMYMAPLDLAKAIQRFREAGLIGGGNRSSEKAGVILNRNLLTALEKQLKMAVGPVAPILIEEALKDLEEATESLAGDKLEILLERLSNAIPSTENRERFQQSARTLAFELSGNETLSANEEGHEGTKG
jgi:DNA-binding MarR family transcriptional regulator